MRIATFNVLHGRSIEDGWVDAARFQGAIAALDADLLALQEVDRCQARSGLLDLPGLAAAAGGAAAWRFTAAAIGTAGRWRPARAGDEVAWGPAYGVVLLSRYPVTDFCELRFPAAPVRSPVLLPGSGRVRLLRDEPRVAVVALLDTPAGPLTVAATHLSFVQVWNAAQLAGLAAALRRFPAPQILMGDLNLPGALPRLVTGWPSLARRPTFPSPRPRLQIDHVLASGRLPPVRSVETPRLAVSDHLPLVVELEA